MKRSPIDNLDMNETGIWGWGGHSCPANHGTVQACMAACDPAPGLAPSPLATACHCRHDSTAAPGPPSLLGSLWSGSRVIRFTPPLHAGSLWSGSRATPPLHAGSLWSEPPLHAGSLWSEPPLHTGLPSSLLARLLAPRLLPVAGGGRFQLLIYRGGASKGD